MLVLLASFDTLIHLNLLLELLFNITVNVEIYGIFFFVSETKAHYHWIVFIRSLLHRSQVKQFNVANKEKEVIKKK